MVFQKNMFDNMLLGGYLYLDYKASLSGGNVLVV